MREEKKTNPEHPIEVVSNAVRRMCKILKDLAERIVALEAANEAREARFWRKPEQKRPVEQKILSEQIAAALRSEREEKAWLEVTYKAPPFKGEGH